MFNCNTYYFKWLGGHGVLVKILGIVIGVVNNITLAVVKATAYRMGFKNSSNRAIFVMIFTFAISYLTLSLITTYHMI